MSEQRPNHQKNKHTIKGTIDRTEQNIAATSELLAHTADRQALQDLSAQNDRREEAIDGMTEALRRRDRHRRQDGEPDGGKGHN